MPADFYTLSPKELSYMMKSHYQKLREEFDEHWRIMRYQTVQLINIQLDGSDRISKVTDLFYIGNEREDEMKRLEATDWDGVEYKMDGIELILKNNYN